MKQAVLVINSGSSTIKFSAFTQQSDQAFLSGLAERLGAQDAVIRFSLQGIKSEQAIPLADHEGALQALIAFLNQHDLPLDSLSAIGHRVVHGGEQFTGSQLIDDAVIAGISACVPLAPLHNPANLLGITTLRALVPDVPQVAVFDTAFHQTLPPKAYLYGLPFSLYRDFAVRRYGFHGTSHLYVVQQAALCLNKPVSELSVISAHLGNGCSAVAVKNGESVDTTMGMTPLEGLVMGTRSGDIDPGLHQFIGDKLGLSLDAVTNLLNKQSGLLGLSEMSNDMRTLANEADAGNAQAALAIEVFCFRLARAIGGLAMSLTSIDALIFTGGIGENARIVREKVVAQLGLLGFQLLPDANENNGVLHDGNIAASGSKPILVIPTNEEWMIASDCLGLI
jgi:acetate kinase